MKILVGCPFSDRRWILDRWVKHVNSAMSEAGCDFSFLFVVGDGNQSDVDALKSISNSTLIKVSESSRADKRQWNSSRYYHMVELRNSLLAGVREISPDLFLSLDSDILLAPEAVSSALDALAKHSDSWAVGLKCFMSPSSVAHPSMGIWANNSCVSFRRKDCSDIATVDIIMAAKLMKPSAYNIDYEFHKNGEDLGWSLNVKGAGGKLIWDGRVTNKHVMSPAFLDTIDKRSGF